MNDTWELLARWPGGTVTALATTGAVRPAALVVAATAAGLHTSADGGRTWGWVALGPGPVPEALAISGSFETDLTVLIGLAGGLYRSTDGGRCWRPALVGSRVQCIAATADFAEGGVLLTGTESDGVMRSDDAGLDWTGASAGLLDLNVTALALSPAFATDRTAFAGTASGLYRSRNGGRAWRLVELGPEAPAIQALAVSPEFEDDRLVFAGTESDGLLRSDDGGQTWPPVPGFPEPCVTSLAFGPTSPAGGRPIVAAGTAAGVAISQDGGEHWRLEAPELGPILCLTVVDDPSPPYPPLPRAGEGGRGVRGIPVVLAGTVGGGIVRRPLGDLMTATESADASFDAAWTPSSSGLAGRATVGMSVCQAGDGEPTIAVATLDAGVLVSPDGGHTWTTGQAGLADLSASSAAVVQPAADEGTPSLLATFASGLYRSDDWGASWQGLQLPGGPATKPSALSVTSTGPGATPVLLAAGQGCLALSLDGGSGWQRVPLPDGQTDVVGAAASPEVARDRTIYLVVRATRVAADGTLEAAGLELWRTDTLGERWTRWLESPRATVMSLGVQRPGDLDTSLLVGHDGRIGRPLRTARQVRRGERRPLWQEAQVGAPGAAVTALSLSPRAGRDRTVLAAADASVYLSRDGGASFVAWDHGLDIPLVTGLALTADGDVQLTAYVLGLGGTLWRRRL